MALDTTPIPIAPDILEHGLELTDCPRCNREQYLEVRLRLGSAHPQEVVEEEYGEGPEAA